MAIELIKRIKESEKEAEEILAEARRESAEIVDQARAEGREWLEQAQSQRQKTVADAVAVAEHEEAKEIEKIRAGFEGHLQQIQTRAAGRRDEAMAMILETMWR